MKSLLILLSLSTGVFASEGVVLLKKKSAPISRTKAEKKFSTSEFEKLKENNEVLKKLLLHRTTTPTIWDGGARILTGKLLRGRLLNSIVSTNLDSPVFVEAYENQGLPYGSRFSSCVGTTKFRRVQTFCSKLVTSEKEIPVSVQILNRDGTAGLLGIYEDGKDEVMAGVIASNMAQGMIAGAQSRVNTGFGEVTGGGLKNELLAGAFNSAKGVSEILTEDMKTKEPIVMIDAGKEVLIYFMEAADVN